MKSKKQTIADDPQPSGAGSKRARKSQAETDDLLEFIMPQLKAGRYAKEVLDLLDLPTQGAVNGEAAVQCASYALETLASTDGTRASCFGVVVKDDKLFFWHYDASSIVYTTQVLSFVQDFEGAVATILAIANCTPEQFGAIPRDVMEPPRPYPDSFPPRDLKGYSFKMASTTNSETYKLTLLKPLNVSYCLTGRRSFVYTADIDPIPAGYPQKTVIVKFSYQVTSRAAEGELVNEAHVCAVGNIPEIHACQNLWDMEDKARAVHEKIRTLMEQYGVKLPEDLAPGARIYEDRVLRSVAYTEYGSLQDLFKDKWQLIPIMVDQMLDCEYASSTMTSSLCLSIDDRPTRFAVQSQDLASRPQHQ